MKIVNSIERYLRELLKIECSPVLWGESIYLPMLLQSDYSYYQVTILGVTAILMIDKKPGEKSPATIKREVEGVRYKFNIQVIYVCEGVSSSKRSRLIEQKVSFIVPGNQMYLPLLRLDLRENFRVAFKPKALLSPSAQAFLLYVLYHKEITQFTILKTAASMGAATMTMKHNFDELEFFGIGEHTKISRIRTITFTVSGKKLWEQAKPFMRSPITRKKTLYGQIPNGGYLSGLSALASHSLIAETAKPVYAFYRDEWKKLKINEPKIINKKTADIEIWSYNPQLFSSDNKVDTLSLFLSMQADPDERIQSALKKMMEEFKW